MDKDTKNEQVFTCSGVNTLLLDKSCKIMNGQNGGGFFVRYRFDQNKGSGFIELLIQYPEGTVVPVWICKNVCKEYDEKNEGVGTASQKVPAELEKMLALELSKGKKLKEIVPQIKEAVKYSSQMDYGRFLKYERPDFKVPMEIIWKQIISHWKDMPVVAWSSDIVLDDVYQELLKVGEEKAEEDSQFADPTAVYLTREDIETVALEVGFRFNELRRVFEARGLWIKDTGSLGYQFTKKIGGKNVRFYKLKKINEIKSININNDFCIDYTEK